MMAAFKAELRKLLTVRTTYVLSLVGIGLTIFFTGYVEGYSLKGAQLMSPNHLNSMITGALTNVPLIFGSIVAILLVTHEYRYNTILYTLSSSNRRLKVLFAKLAAITLYALVFTTLIAVIAPVASLIGIALHGNHLAPQQLDYASLVWRSLFYGWSSVVSSLIIALIVRSQVGAIVTMFVLPTAEVFLTPLLKAKAVYLPFTGAADAILQTPGGRDHGALSYAHAAIVFGIYLLIGWVVASLLFLRRDAN